MFMISIQKGHNFLDENQKPVGPFEAFECSSAFAQKQGRFNPKLMGVEDYVGIVNHRPDHEVRQLARNAGLDGTLPMAELKPLLMALAKVKKEEAEDPSEPSKEDPSADSDKEELTEMTVADLRKMASDLKIAGYANLKKDDLVDAILEAMNEGGEEQ